MSTVSKITGSLEGTTITGEFGLIYAISHTDIEISGAIGQERFTLPYGTTFGTLGLAGGTAFPNDIASITAYGQGEVIAVTTDAVGGGGVTNNFFTPYIETGYATEPSQSGNWRFLPSQSGALHVQYWDAIGSEWITDSMFTGIPISGSGNVISASYALTASYVDGAVSYTPDPFVSTPEATNIVTLTAAEYSALTTPSSSTIYVVI